MPAKAAAMRSKGDDAASSVRRLSYEFTALFNAGEIDRLVELYCADAMQLAPNEPTARGREAVRDSLAYHRDTIGMRNLRSVEEHLEVSGDLATEAGEYAVEVSGASYTRYTDVGKYVRVFRRESTGWRILLDAWSTNAPE